jgi:hypothetical protein
MQRVEVSVLHPAQIVIAQVVIALTAADIPFIEPIMAHSPWHLALSLLHLPEL